MTDSQLIPFDRLAGPIDAVLDACRHRLDPWLGQPSRARAESSVTLIYRFESEIPPVRPLRLKIEINTREHFTVLGFRQHALTVDNPWCSGQAQVTTYELDELLATKLRALYQRRKGRDLFDLWLCLSRDLLDPQHVLACFHNYMKHQGHSVSIPCLNKIITQYGNAIGPWLWYITSDVEITLLVAGRPTKRMNPRPAE